MIKDLAQYLKDRSRPAENGCIEWTGARSYRGYGRFRMGTEYIGAHRASWMVAHGEIPAGMHVCHKCDNPPCINPDHLFLGTPAENMADRDAKGRSGTQGRPSKRRKLTWEQIQDIRQEYVFGSQDKNTLTLAEKYHVNHYVIWLIVNNRTYTNAAG